MRETVFLDYTQEELDHAYDQRAWAANADAVLQSWHDAVAPVRRSFPDYREHAYGDGSRNRLDVYPCAQPGAPIHIHVHGGAWRAQTKEDVAILAPATAAAGMHLVAPDFDLLPQVRMPDMIDQLVEAVRWVHANAESFGGASDRILLSGHSSGAHLAAALATLDWEARGLPADVIKALVCLSGAYDLGSVMISARRSYIDLSEAEVDELSAPRHVDRIRCPVWVFWGDRETPEFIRQGKAFAVALEAAGRLAGAAEVADTNHFEICGAMTDPESPVYRALVDAGAVASGAATAEIGSGRAAHQVTAR